MERIRNFRQDKSGATAVEYGLLVALIGIACTVAIGLLGINNAAVFTNVNLSSPSSPAVPETPAVPEAPAFPKAPASRPGVPAPPPAP